MKFCKNCLYCQEGVSCLKGAIRKVNIVYGTSYYTNRQDCADARSEKSEVTALGVCDVAGKSYKWGGGSVIRAIRQRRGWL